MTQERDQNASPRSPGNPVHGALEADMAIDRIVDRRLVSGLLENARSALFVSILGACVLYFAIWRTTGSDSVAYWLWAVMAVATVRLVSLPWLKHRLDSSHTQRVGTLYAASALIGGLSWALVAIYDTAMLPMGTQLVVLIALVSIPVASVSSNAIYRPAFYLFATPIWAAMFYWIWRLVPDLKFELSALAAIYTGLVLMMANRYHQTLKRSLRRDIENERLLREVNTMNTELQRLAFQDSLTGLSNRRSFEASATELLHRRREGEILALMLIDMDNFKWINDNLGHAVGDAALVELSRRIDQNSRLNEVVANSHLGAARIGGDEFIVIYRLHSVADIGPLASRILEALVQPMTFIESDYCPGVSIGIALAPVHGNHLDSLLRAADGAMYRAKDAGGRRYTVAGSGDEPDDTSATAEVAI